MFNDVIISTTALFLSTPFFLIVVVRLIRAMYSIKSTGIFSYNNFNTKFISLNKNNLPVTMFSAGLLIGSSIIAFVYFCFLK